jgi:hypothetical protein
VAYPATLDVLTDPAGAALMNDPALLHSVVEKSQNDSIEAVQTALGLNPQGASATVTARILATETVANAAIPSSTKAQPLGVASLDASSLLVQNVDASKIASGTLPLARLVNIPVSKIDIASGAFNVANIPSLDAAKITTGTFSTSRIPGLPGSIITSGTIGAGFLPSSVTANANATVVADQTARDAIALVDRADGKLVHQKARTVLWAWRADNSTWVQVGGPGFETEPPVQFNEATDHLAFTSTTFTAGSPNCGIAFKGPQSGQVYITVHCNFESNTAGSIVYVGFEVRTTATVGGGSVFYAANTDDTVANGATTRMLASSRFLVTGLTAGADYNVRTMHQITANNGDIFNRRVMVEPVH